MASDARKPSSLGRTAARAGILAPSPTSESLTPSRRKPQALTQENFSPRSELQRLFCGCKISSYFFSNTDDLTPPAHTTQ